MNKDSTIKTIIRDIIREELIPLKTALTAEILSGVERLLSGFRSDQAAMKLEILGELEKSRMDTTISAGKIRKINEIGDRVEKLEKIHPKFSHAAI